MTTTPPRSINKKYATALIATSVLTGVVAPMVTPMLGEGTAYAAEMNQSIVTSAKVIDKDGKVLTGNHFVGKQVMGEQKVKLDFSFPDSAVAGDTFAFSVDNEFMISAANSWVDKTLDLKDANTGNKIATYSAKRVKDGAISKLVWIITIDKESESLKDRKGSITIDIQPNADEYQKSYMEGSPIPEDAPWEELYYERVSFTGNDNLTIDKKDKVNLGVSQKDKVNFREVPRTTSTTKETSVVTTPGVPTSVTPSCTPTTTTTITVTNKPSAKKDTSVDINSIHEKFAPVDGIVDIDRANTYVPPSNQKRDVTITFNSGDNWKFNTNISNAEILKMVDVDLAIYDPYTQERIGTNCYQANTGTSDYPMHLDVYRGQVEVLSVSPEKISFKVKDVPENTSVDFSYQNSDIIQSQMETYQRGGMRESEIHSRYQAISRKIGNDYYNKAGQLAKEKAYSNPEDKKFLESVPLYAAYIDYIANMNISPSVEEFIKNGMVEKYMFHDNEYGTGSYTKENFDKQFNESRINYSKNISDEEIKQFVINSRISDAYYEYTSQLQHNALEDFQKINSQYTQEESDKLISDPQFQKIYLEEYIKILKETEEQYGLVREDFNARYNKEYYDSVNDTMQQLQSISFNDNLGTPIGTGWFYKGEKQEFRITTDTTNPGGVERKASDGYDFFVVGAPLPGVEGSGTGIVKEYKQKLDVYLNDADTKNPTGKTSIGASSEQSVSIKSKKGEDVNGNFSVKISNTGNVVMKDPTITLPDGTTKKLTGITVYPGENHVENITMKLSTTPTSSYAFKVDAEGFTQSNDTVTASYQETPFDNESHNPSYPASTVAPGKEISVKQTGDTKIPGDATYSIPGNVNQNGWTVSVDPKTGEVKATAPETAKTGDTITIPVTVTYADKSTDVVNAVINVMEDAKDIEVPIEDPTETETPTPNEPVVTTTTKTSENNEPVVTTTKTSENNEPVVTTTKTSENNEPVVTTTKTSESSKPEVTTTKTSESSKPEVTTTKTTKSNDPVATTPKTSDSNNTKPEVTTTKTTSPEVKDPITDPTDIPEIKVPEIKSPQEILDDVKDKMTEKNTSTPSPTKTSSDSKSSAPSVVENNKSETLPAPAQKKNPQVNTGGQAEHVSLWSKIKEFFMN